MHPVLLLLLLLPPPSSIYLIYLIYLINLIKLLYLKNLISAQLSSAQLISSEPSGLLLARWAQPLHP